VLGGMLTNQNWRNPTSDGLNRNLNLAFTLYHPFYYYFTLNRPNYGLNLELSNIFFFFFNRCRYRSAKLVPPSGSRKSRYMAKIMINSKDTAYLE
jgi:hypothetical protein